MTHPRGLMTSLVLVVMLMACPVLAQPMADRVPADALVYVGWQGTDTMGEAYEASRLKAVLEAAEVSKLLTETLPAMLEAEAARDPELRQMQQVLREVAPVLWHRPWAFYFAGLDWPAADEGGVPAPGAAFRPRKEPVGRVGFLVDVGDEGGPLVEQLERLVAEAAQHPSPAKLELTRAEGVIELHMRPATATEPAGGDEAAAGAAVASLADSARYQAALAQVLDDPAFVFYVDASGLLAMLREAIERDPSTTPRFGEAWPRVIAATGLDGVDQFIWAGGFDGRDWAIAGFIQAPAPRRGLVAALLDTPPIDDATLQLVPAGATWLTAAPLDLAALLAAVREAFTAVGPEARGMFDMGFGATMAVTGRNLEQDLLAALGELWLVYNDPNVAGPLGLGLCIVNPLRDPERLDATLRHLARLAEGAMAQQADAGFRLRITTTTLGDTTGGQMTVHSVTTPFVSPSWAVHDGRLYIALFPQALVTAHQYATQPEQSILDNEKFAAVLDRLDAPSIGALSYADLPQTAPAAYQSYLMMSQLLTSMAAQADGVQTPAMVLPPLGAIMPHLAPTAQVGWVDDLGYHTRGISPFPGSSMFSQQGMMGGMQLPLAVGILMPALGAARQTARQMQSLTQLRSLTLGLHLYAQDHDDRAPERLHELLGYVDDPAMFLHPADVSVPPDFADWPAERQHAWIDEHASFVYIPPGEALSAIENPSEHIVLVTRPQFAREDQIGVGYVDGHAAIEPIDLVDERLRAQTGRSLWDWTSGDAGADEPTPPAPAGPPPAPRH